jgi:hypothetical protein
MRYDWTHAILGGDGVQWGERDLPSQRRISLMFRDVPRSMMRNRDGSNVAPGQPIAPE